MRLNILADKSFRLKEFTVSSNMYITLLTNQIICDSSKSSFSEPAQKTRFLTVTDNLISTLERMYVDSF